MRVRQQPPSTVGSATTLPVTIVFVSDSDEVAEAPAAPVVYPRRLLVTAFPWLMEEGDVRVWMTPRRAGCAGSSRARPRTRRQACASSHRHVLGVGSPHAARAGWTWRANGGYGRTLQRWHMTTATPESRPGILPTAARQQRHTLYGTRGFDARRVHRLLALAPAMPEIASPGSAVTPVWRCARRWFEPAAALALYTSLR
jgi:hypothetical protein